MNRKSLVIAVVMIIVLTLGMGCIKTPPNGSNIINKNTLDKIVFEPENGQYLYYDSQLSIGIKLESANAGIGVAPSDYFTMYNQQGKKGDPCLLIMIQIDSELSRDVHMVLSATGYNSSGQKVSFDFDVGPLIGSSDYFLPARSRGEGILHLTMSTDIQKIVISSSGPSDIVPP